MKGKETCKILKEIRQKIADENDIPYVTEECGYKGECRGTCPKCEDDVRYLEKQLKARAAAGKRVALTALCVGITVSAAGCSQLVNDTDHLSGDVVIQEEEQKDQSPLRGKIAPPSIPDEGPDDDDHQLAGDIICPEE